MIGIIVAMDEEIEALTKEMTEVVESEIASMHFWSGQLYEKPVIVAVCGIGKVNAALCVQVLVSEFKVDQIINTGVAGGLDPAIRIGDMVIAENCVEHDMDTSVFGDPIGQVPRMDVFAFPCDDALVTAALEAAVKAADGSSVTETSGTESDWTCYSGRIVSGDQFIADQKKSLQLRDTFGAAACEMEGAAIAHAAYMNKLPCVIIRSISDNASTGAAVSYTEFKPIAIAHELSVIRQIVAGR